MCVRVDEREAVQKKTFTKWVNSHLSRVSCRITDLYMDLRDGRMLIKLLEVLSGEKLVLHCTALHCTSYFTRNAHHSTYMEYTALHGTALHNTCHCNTHHSAALYWNLLDSLHCTVQHLA